MSARERFAELSPERQALVRKLLAAKAAEPELVLDAPLKVKKQKQYDGINRRLDASEVGAFAYFLNYGYVPTAAPEWSVVELGPHVVDRASRRLILEVIGDCPLEGRSVLDVGCGRGAAAVVLKEHFRPARYLGIDLSHVAIAFCAEQHGDDTYAFRQGDAERLPVEDARFDVAINVESSHCYPNVGAFYAEIARALVPGGRFLYTDFFPRGEVAAVRERLRRAGLELEREQDITENVLAACDELAPKRLSLFRNAAEREYMANVLAAPGSETYARLAHGESRYLLLRARAAG